MNRFWTPEVLRDLVKLREKGMTRRSVAEVLAAKHGREVTEQAVKTALRDYASHLVKPPCLAKASPRATATERILFVPDTHRPFHDELAWSTMVAAARGFKPDIIVVLGDFLDAASLSRHPKESPCTVSFEEEVEDANKGLDELDSVGATRKFFVEGNHETRIARAVAQDAPQIFGFVSTQKVLRLRERGWKFTPYRQHLTLGKLHVTHDLGIAGANAHMRAIQTMGSNAIIGHVHSIGLTVLGNALGEHHVGACFGWLGSEKAADYMHRANVRRNWCHGFGTGHMEPNGTVHLQAHPIINGRVVVDGRLYQG